ncbi:peptidase A24 [Leifsonia sp. Root112D2]|nr:peptidase A24 [Leifsonia sp. Root112D2]
MIVVAIVIGVFGSLIGSFLNVVVYRVPLKQSIVSPPSACPRCGALIRGYDNIPMLSWLLLRGRCRSCSAPISRRYPLVELGTALFFAAVAWWWLGADLVGASGESASGGTFAARILVLVAFLYLAAVSVALALIDIDTHTLPNRLVLPSYIVGAALLAAAGIVVGNFGALISAGIGCAALFVLYAILAIVRPGGMGLGDVKLAGVLGLFLEFLGWPQLVVGAFAAFLLGGLYAIALLALRRAKRGSGIPFGPWMLGGAWVGIFFGNIIMNGYLSLVGLA